MLEKSSKRLEIHIGADLVKVVRVYFDAYRMMYDQVMNQLVFWVFRNPPGSNEFLNDDALLGVYVTPGCHFVGGVTKLWIILCAC